MSKLCFRDCQSWAQQTTNKLKDMTVTIGKLLQWLMVVSNYIYSLTIVISWVITTMNLCKLVLQVPQIGLAITQLINNRYELV